GHQPNHQPAKKSTGHRPPIVRPGHTPSHKTAPASHPVKRSKKTAKVNTSRKTQTKALRRPGQPRPGPTVASGKRLTTRKINKYNGPRKQLKRTVFDPRYHRNYGKRFTYSYRGSSNRAWYYPGKKHYHWQYCCWNSQYSKWFFFDPCT